MLKITCTHLQPCTKQGGKVARTQACHRLAKTAFTGDQLAKLMLCFAPSIVVLIDQ